MERPERALDTQELINKVTQLDLGSPTRDREAATRERVQWESTDSYLNADVNALSRSKSPRQFNVSERTVIIGDDLVPITPIHRTVSGSSLELQVDDDDDDGTDEQDLLAQRQQTTSVRHVIPLDLHLLEQLLSQLPLTETNAHFQGIFANYIAILEEHELDPATDKFIITVYNQLRSGGDYSKLYKVIDIFVKHPCNEAMKLSNFLHFREFNNMAKFFKIWLIKRRKNHEMDKNVQAWQLYLKKKYIAAWYFRLKSVTEDYQNNAEIFAKVKSTMKFWDIWRANFEECQELETVCDLQTQSKILSKWVDRLNSSEKGKELYSTNLLRKIFKQWRLKSITAQRILSVFFAKWTKKARQLEVMEQCASDLEMALLGGFFFTKWKGIMSRSLGQTHQLEEIHKAYSKQKFLSLWRYNLFLKLKQNEVIEKRREFLKQFVMNQFKRKFENDQKAQKFLDNLRGKLMARYFGSWYYKLTLRKYERSIEQSTFQSWREKVKLKKLGKYHEGFVQQIFLNKWIKKYTQVMDSSELAKKAMDSYTKVIYFENWKRSLTELCMDSKAADRMAIKKFFTKLSAKKRSIDEMTIRAANVYKEDPWNTVKTLFFQKWNDAYDNRVEIKLLPKISEFEAQISKTRTLNALRAWYDRYQTYVDQEILFKRDFLKETLLRPTFDRWLQQYDLFNDLEQRANGMNETNLLSTGLTKLQLAYLRTQELQLSLVEFEEERDLKLSMTYLNLWSIELMKARRDNEAVDKFRSRWSRARLRGILSLWRSKLEDTMESTFRALSDESFDPDDSPTRGKSPISSFEAMITPQKFTRDPLETSSLLYSGGRSTMPGSERIRRKRMEALKVRYSQVKKAIPSPLKKDRKLDDSFLSTLWKNDEPI